VRAHDGDVERLRGATTSLRRIRLVCVAFTVLQFGLYVPPDGLEVPFVLWPVAVVIIAWLLATNLATRLFGRGTGIDRWRRLAAGEVVVDAIVALGIVASFNFDETLRLWPVLSLPILEAAMRFSLRPTLATWALVGTVYAADQIRLLPTREEPETWIGHIPYALGLLLIIGLISGLLARRAERAREQVERGAAKLRDLSDFSRDLSAIRETDALVRELLRAALALTGFTSAEHHVATDGTWRCTQRLDLHRPTATPLPIAPYDFDALARAPHSPRTVTPYASTIARIVLVALPHHGDAVAALAVGTNEDGAALSADDLDVLVLLAAHAAVALENATLIERENATIEELRSLHAMKDDFVSIFSHELKSPLTSVSGYAELLRRRWEEIAPADRERYLDAIDRNGQQLARLIDDVVQATRGDRPDLAAQARPVDLGPLVAAVAEEEVTPSPLHRLELDLAPDLPPVMADPDRARQVVRNLVNNAVKYSPEGGRVHTELTREGHELVLRVTDDGVGIADHLRGQLFQKFSRLPSRVQVEGTGLGLYLCRQLVEQMGGTIGVESEPDRGSTFWVRLPAGQVPVPPASTTSATAAQP